MQHHILQAQPTHVTRSRPADGGRTLPPDPVPPISFDNASFGTIPNVSMIAPPNSPIAHVTPPVIIPFSSPGEQRIDRLVASRSSPHTARSQPNTARSRSGGHAMSPQRVDGLVASRCTLSSNARSNGGHVERGLLRTAFEYAHRPQRIDQLMASRTTLRWCTGMFDCPQPRSHSPTAASSARSRSVRNVHVDPVQRSRSTLSYRSHSDSPGRVDRLAALGAWLAAANLPPHVFKALHQAKITTIHELKSATVMTLERAVPLHRERKVLQEALQRERSLPSALSRSSSALPGSTQPVVRSQSPIYKRNSRGSMGLYPSKESLKILKDSQVMAQMMLKRRASFVADKTETCPSFGQRRASITETSVKSPADTIATARGRSNSNAASTPPLGSKTHLVLVPPHKMYPPAKVGDVPKRKTPAPLSDEALIAEVKKRLTAQLLQYDDFLANFTQVEIPEALLLMGFTLFDRKRLETLLAREREDKQ